MINGIATLILEICIDNVPERLLNNVTVDRSLKVIVLRELLSIRRGDLSGVYLMP